MQDKNKNMQDKILCILMPISILMNFIAAWACYFRGNILFATFHLCLVITLFISLVMYSRNK
jgi:hypothetical protein